MKWTVREAFKAVIMWLDANGHAELARSVEEVLHGQRA